MTDHRIERLAEDAVVATPPDGGVPTLLVKGPGARIFHRRGHRLPAGGEPSTVTWLVGELDGVRVYCDGLQLVLTRQELYP